jgi:phosphatidylglycerophosphate synthase
MSGSVITPELRARVRGIAVPIALALGRMGLTPNALTVIGFGIAVVAAVAAAQGAWALAGLLVIFGGIFDLFDGALARATNRVSRVGGFLDSVFDRAGEGVVYIGIIVGCVGAPLPEGVVLAALAMTAAFMVSYVRAKSESLGFTPGSSMAAVGLAPREVRLVILTIGLLISGAAGGVGWYPEPSGLDRIDDPLRAGSVPLLVALALIAVLATITTIQRILHVVRQPSSEEHE